MPTTPQTVKLPRELTVSSGTFDRVNTFSVALGHHAGFRCSLEVDYKAKGDGILWIMQNASVLASSYSQDEDAERARLNSEEPVKNGDYVTANGDLYRVRVLGDYSDCAILDRVTPEDCRKFWTELAGI